ncbi:hypothetical protein [Leptospira weilii]|uniref:Uncharacterized protein n=1 Tax=Leptospira weilii str. 2006001855 TaxID=996804 RepID=M6FUG8_9LEPT|nr:hypothetical protein [Leptospira weilii]EMM73719.1 hypothetical protein LEP1GSC038_2785 [Leptospira weilii str. 2006001855]EMN45548.1 hypothetical protein LEP1GSC086_2681 [Leptospira weilii str. LNT 1234]MCL8268608.1 hypothetical protein [Leptospira weilii]QDK23037.1 hypothetical protein FHG67_10145 [Leptospira weilii]QDK27319.1 hypothetical protein FHG68_12090 [Leptospira weilii]
MTKFSKKYTDYHFHPEISDNFEIVCYERKDAGFDVYIFEKKNSVPEFEESRVDQFHIFLGTINSEDEFEEFYNLRIRKLIGNKYELIPYYAEKGSRKVCGKIFDALKNLGCYGMLLSSNELGDYTISIRRKDVEIAKTIVQSNVL